MIWHEGLRKLRGAAMTRAYERGPSEPLAQAVEAALDSGNSRDAVKATVWSQMRRGVSLRKQGSRTL